MLYVIITITTLIIISMIYKVTLNPFYPVINAFHNTYWKILTKGKMSIHPNDPNHNLINTLSNIERKINWSKPMRFLDNIDHKYGTKLRQRFNKKLRLGDIYIKTNGCPYCGSDLEITSGIGVTCTNWQHPHMKDVYYKGGKRNCDYSLMGG